MKVKALHLGLFVFFFAFSASALVPQTESEFKTFIKKRQQIQFKSEYSKSVQSLFGKDESPAYVSGDFNGDGSLDHVALLVRSNKDFICIYSNSLKPKAYKCLKMTDQNPKRYLSKISKKDVKFKSKKHKPVDLYQVEIFLGPTNAYYLEDGQVKIFEGEVRQ